MRAVAAFQLLVDPFLSMVPLAIQSTRFDTRLNRQNIGTASMINPHRLPKSCHQPLMLHVHVQVSLLPRHCKLGLVHVIGGYLHESVDGQDPKDIPVGDDLKVATTVAAGRFKPEIAINQLNHRRLRTRFWIGRGIECTNNRHLRSDLTPERACAPLGT